MFFKKKPKKQSSPGVDEELLDFLTEADRLYERAYKTRDIMCLREYYTVNACRQLGRIIPIEAPTRYFADEKFKETTWEVVSKTDNVIVVNKSVVYKDFKVANTRMKASEDYKEQWFINYTPDEFMVDKVTKLN